MNAGELVRMANQIADFFAAYPHDEAVAGIADHIVKFWDPRMRAALSDYLKSGGDGLNDLAFEAAQSLEQSASA